MFLDLRSNFDVLDVDVAAPPETKKETSVAQQMSIADMGPNIDRLWSYTCPMTKGRNVSSMTWNKLNPVSRGHHI